jgi:hypothetical protein
MFKGVSRCVSLCEYTLFWSLQPLVFLSLPFLPIPHYSAAFSAYLYVVYSHYIMYSDIVDFLLLSSPFPLPSTTIKELHYCKHVLHKNVYMTIFGFVYMFIFWLYLVHMRKNMQSFSFWTWLISLNMMSSNFIHLPSNHTVSFFLMAE